MLGLPLVLVSSGMFIAAWVMDVRFWPINENNLSCWLFLYWAPSSCALAYHFQAGLSLGLDLNPKPRSAKALLPGLALS